MSGQDDAEEYALQGWDTRERGRTADCRCRYPLYEASPYCPDHGCLDPGDLEGPPR